MPSKVVVAKKHIRSRSLDATTDASIMGARNVVQALQTEEPVHRGDAARRSHRKGVRKGPSTLAKY